MEQLIFLGNFRFLWRLNQIVLLRLRLALAVRFHCRRVKHLVDQEACLVLALCQSVLRVKQGIKHVFTFCIIVQNEGKLITLLLQLADDWFAVLLLLDELRTLKIVPDLISVVLTLVAHVDDSDALDRKPVLTFSLAILQSIVVDVQSPLIKFCEVV